MNYEKNDFLNPLYFIDLDFKKNPLQFLDLISSKSSRQYLLELKTLEIVNLSKIISEFFSSFNLDLSPSDLVLFGFSFKEITGKNKISRLKRLSSEKYIHSKIINLYYSLKDTHIIYKTKSKGYMSNYGQSIIKQRILKEENYLKSITVKDLTTGKFILNENQEIMTMFEMTKNAKKNKLSELYFAQKSLENMAKQQDYTFLFITLTLPAVFKPNPLNGHCSYNKDNAVKDGVLILNEVWRTFQKRKSDIEKNNFDLIPKSLQKYKLHGMPFGFGCKEPQSDGTPHSHFLMYCDKRDIELLKKLWYYCAILIFRKHKFTFSYKATIKIIIEDKKKGGSASTYIFKYIMKTLGVSSFKTFEGNNVDIDKKDTEESFKRYRLDKYRRYSFFGVSTFFNKWRELKRLCLDAQLLKSAFEQVNSLNDKNIYNSFRDLIRSVNMNNYIDFVECINKLDLKMHYREYINKYNEVVKVPIGLKLIYKDNEIVFKTRKKWVLIDNKTLKNPLQNNLDVKVFTFKVESVNSDSEFFPFTSLSNKNKSLSNFNKRKNKYKRFSFCY